MLYAGTDDGLIQVTADGGKNWRKIEKFPGVPDMTYVARMLASLHRRRTPSTPRSTTTRTPTSLRIC